MPYNSGRKPTYEFEYDKDSFNFVIRYLKMFLQITSATEDKDIKRLRKGAEKIIDTINNWGGIYIFENEKYFFVKFYPREKNIFDEILEYTENYISNINQKIEQENFKIFDHPDLVRMIEETDKNFFELYEKEGV